MNPDKSQPIKFPKNTRVILTRGENTGCTGTLVQERHGVYSNKVALDGGMFIYADDYQLESLPVPDVGDLVKVTKSGRFEAQEGHVISREGNYFFVDVDYEYERPEFLANQLVVIEKVTPKPVRIEGRPIKPEAIKRGDKISVVNIEENDIKRTTIMEGTVDRILNKGFHNGLRFEFQTRSGAKIYSNENPNSAVISLVADIDKDLDFVALSEIKPNEIIGFPDVEGGLETNIAVKKEYGSQWTVLIGEKSPKSMETAALVAVLKKKNVTFSVIRKLPDPLEFPIGTNVKVKGGNPLNLYGDYRVIVAREDVSTIKSRGISASTHTIDNKWLTKG